MTLIRPFRPAAAGPGPQLSAIGEDPLVALAEAGYAAALGELADPEPWSSYRAIAQLSGHLAVMKRAVLPAARSWLDPGHRLPAAGPAAPTRPHPRCLRGRLLSPLTFRFLGGWDRLLDEVDSRPGAGHSPPEGVAS
ncbi:MAG: hypothetical protein ACRDPO_26865 [Streptosporangiaceae bacterium]